MSIDGGMTGQKATPAEVLGERGTRAVRDYRGHSQPKIPAVSSE